MRQRRAGDDDGRGPLQRTRDELPEWAPRGARIAPALKAARRRGPDADMGRIERARASWASAGYEPGLDEQIRAPRLRRSVTIAIVSATPSAGTSTVTALLATLFAHVARERAVVVDVAGGDEPSRAPARRTVVLRDCGADTGQPAVARADQVVLVLDAGAPVNALPTPLAAAPALVVVVNGLSRRGPRPDAEAIERALPDAFGVLGVGHDRRRAARVAEGSFSWAENGGRWDVELRELAALLAAGWVRLGVAAAPTSASRAAR